MEKRKVLLSYNLQFFAKDGPGGEKTEEPTAKKLNDARGEGQVAKSKEIANAFGMLALFIILKIYLGIIGSRFIEFFNVVYGQIPDVVKRYEGQTAISALQVVIRSMMIQLLLLVLPVLAVGFGVAFVCDLWQVKWRPTTKPLRPKFSKLSPVKGFKRIFSGASLMELLKSILKLSVIGYVVYSFLKGRVDQVFTLYDITLNRAISLIGEIVVELGIRIAAVYMVIAILDFAYQKWKFKEDMKMTKQEVKDEYKNTEGNPEIKGRQRSKMREASQRRMMQSLPTADVVITNPTHYAVAVKYDADHYSAPIVVAKGEDFLAMKIKEKAKEHQIEIVENKPLARMLYANVDVGEEVPPELYQAVAEVLAFVYNLRGNK